MFRATILSLLIVVPFFVLLGCQQQAVNPVEVTEHEILVTEENFEADVVNSKLPVLLDFSASWCPPCRKMAPIVRRIAEENDGKLVVGVVDTDRDDTQQLSEAFRVSGIPTFVILVDGEPVASTSGGSSEAEFRAWVDRYASKPE